MNSRKKLRWFLLYPALLFAGCHTLFTGSPIPLWSLERLNDPQEVEAITETHLHLRGGTEVTLPFIKSLPKDNPLFREAVRAGVEIDENGEVFGLLWLDPSCGMPPSYPRRMRINLTDLAGALNPRGLDDLTLPPELIDRLPGLICLKPRRSHRKGHLSDSDLSALRRVRWHLEMAEDIAQ